MDTTAIYIWLATMYVCVSALVCALAVQRSRNRSYRRYGPALTDVWQTLEAAADAVLTVPQPWDNADTGIDSGQLRLGKQHSTKRVVELLRAFDAGAPFVAMIESDGDVLLDIASSDVTKDGLRGYLGTWDVQALGWRYIFWEFGSVGMLTNGKTVHVVPSIVTKVRRWVPVRTREELLDILGGPPPVNLSGSRATRDELVAVFVAKSMLR